MRWKDVLVKETVTICPFFESVLVLLRCSKEDLDGVDAMHIETNPATGHQPWQMYSFNQ